MRFPKEFFAQAIVILGCCLRAAGNVQGPNLTSEFALTGHFAKEGVPGPLTGEYRGLPGRQIFGSWNDGDNFQGTLTSGYFEASPVVGMQVSGFLTNSGAKLYLERQSDGSRLRLQTRIDPEFGWELRSWKLGRGWAGERVRLVASGSEGSGPRAWIGLSPPQRGGNSLLFVVERAAFRLVLLWFYSLLLFMPGIGLGVWANRKSNGDMAGAALMAMVGMGLAGYLTFWVYFLRGPAAGKWVSVILVLSGFLTLILSGRKQEWRSLALPLAAVAIASGIYCSFGFLYPTETDPNQVAERRFFAQDLPPDNILPLIMERRLYSGELLRGELTSGWRSSDRPPLQAGLILMIRPFNVLTTPELQYQLAGTALQCTWILSAWILLSRLGFAAVQIIPVIAMMIFSGFAFLHGVFIWPKLLAASYTLLGISLFFEKGQVRAGLAGLCFALALLSHSGCAFTLLGLGFLFWLLKDRVPLKSRVAFIAAIVVLFVPWILFQRFYDPPGDALLKLSLTGNMFSPGSLPHAIIEAYRPLSVANVIGRKMADARVLFFAGVTNAGLSGSQWWLAAFLGSSFFSLFAALGLFNLGLFARLQLRTPGTPYRNLDKLAVCVGISVVIWIAVMFDSGGTVIHQGSLANILLLMAAFGCNLQARFPRGIYLVLAVQAVIVFPLFVFSKRTVEGIPGVLFDGWLDTGMLLAAVGLCCGLVFLAWYELQRLRWSIRPS